MEKTVFRDMPYTKAMGIGFSIIYCIYFYLTLSTEITYTSMQVVFHVIINSVFVLTITSFFYYGQDQLKNDLRYLREKQTCLIQAENSSLVMVAHAGLKGEIIKVPPAMCKLLGYEEEELLNMNIRDITYPLDLHEQMEKVSLLTRGEVNSFDMEKRYVTKNGELVWVYMNVSLVMDIRGNPHYVIAYIHDITERKNMEINLTRSEKKLRRITDNILDVICETDIEGIFQYVSPSVQNILGYDEKVLIGRPVFDFVHQEDREKIQIVLEMTTSNLSWGRLEIRFLHKSGYLVWMEVGANIILNVKGYIEGCIICARDITERKKAELALQQSEERYTQLFENSYDAIAVYSEGKFLFVNKAMVKLLGVEGPEDLIGKYIIDVIHPDYQKAAEDRTRMIEEGWEKTVPLQEEKLIRSDGSVIDVEVATISFPYRGRTAIQIVMKEITDRRRIKELQENARRNEELLRQALEYDRLKTEFFSNISHELRTPLNVILGSLQLLFMYKEDRSTSVINRNMEKHLKVMKQNCYRLLRIVNNLIDITKIDAGFYYAQMENRNIVSVIEEITLSVAGYIESKGIEIEFDTDTEEKIIACDGDKMERIMLNLLSNAVKFTDQGGKTSVNLYCKEKKVFITVKDTGCGIDEDKLEIVFERFRQADEVLTRKHEGSGIGLSLVRSLVEMQEGTISVKSKKGEGSEFTIILPEKKVCSQQEKDDEVVNENYMSRIERINIEFSDIYS